MLRKVSFLLAMACMVSCRTQKLDLTPAIGPQFRSLQIKFNYDDSASRQNGRILWRFDGERSKFIFFTPLSQVGLELDLTGEDAVLVNFSRKEYWRGGFNVLLERLWGVDMTFFELKELLLFGAVPTDRFAEKGIAVDLERAPASGAPRSVRLRQGHADLSLRITRDESRAGKVVLAGYERRYRAADLESVLEGSE